MGLTRGQCVAAAALLLIGVHAAFAAVLRFWPGGHTVGGIGLTDTDNVQGFGRLGLAFLGLVLATVLVARALRRYGRGRFAVPALVAALVVGRIDGPFMAFLALVVVASLLLPARDGRTSPEPAIAP